MMNKIFKRTTISLIRTFRQTNLLKFQNISVKFFGKFLFNCYFMERINPISKNSNNHFFTLYNIMYFKVLKRKL